MSETTLLETIQILLDKRIELRSNGARIYKHGAYYVLITPGKDGGKYVKVEYLNPIEAIKDFIREGLIDLE